MSKRARKRSPKKKKKKKEKRNENRDILFLPTIGNVFFANFKKQIAQFVH